MAQETVVRIMCPNLTCQRILSVPGEARGKLVKCRSCGTTLRVPSSKAPQANTAEEGAEAGEEAA